MQRIALYTVAVFLVGASILSCHRNTSGHKQTATSASPNIILIMTDDQGYGDLGVTGNPVIETPNIDALAKQSASMSHFYVSPVCSPTRASLMTGRYNYRTRVVDTYVGRSMMDSEEVTLAEALKTRGFRTGIFGKWHLGDAYPMRPNDQGFDEALVHFGGGLAQPSEPLHNNRRYTDPILYHNGEEVQTQGYCTNVYFDRALSFIEQSQQQQKPFFAYIATNAPHDPFHDVPEELLAKYRKKGVSSALRGDFPNPEKRAEDLARIYAMVDNVDQNVGKLMRKLDEWDLSENTIVIFMTDNGPQTTRYNGPFRGGKGQVWEGSIRTCFFMRWPERLKAGTVSDRPVAHIDIMPTLLEAAGTSLPQDRIIDGRSFLPLVEGKEVEWPERTLYMQWHRGDEPKPFIAFAARAPRYKLLSPNGEKFELYDIQNDPSEKQNLADQLPEVVEKMKADYMTWFRDVSGTRPDNYAKPHIVLGTDHETTTRLSQQDWVLTQGQGWGEQGHWKVEVARPASFDAEVVLDKPHPGWQLSISGSGKTFRGTITNDGTKGTIPNITLPAGKTDLQVSLSNGEKEVGPYQVILKRR
ncbi:arylsulfatase [Telluribacter humicola]|uniref:arylsulfatase n=1 Tax=Telluribacter humicola TaxID=1720261 RepID=UPI001A969E93|nr:arylsulfatase [Telluribacter humicola]